MPLLFYHIPSALVQVLHGISKHCDSYKLKLSVFFHYLLEAIQKKVSQVFIFMSFHRKFTCHHHRDVTQKSTEVQPADGLWNYKPSPDPFAE